MNKKMTMLQAYYALYRLLENYYAKTSSDDIGSLLGGMALLEDGLPADAALWHDWTKAVRDQATDSELTQAAALRATVEFLGIYRVLTSSNDAEEIIIALQTDSAMHMEWKDHIDFTLSVDTIRDRLLLRFIVSTGGSDPSDLRMTVFQAYYAMVLLLHEFNCQNYSSEVRVLLDALTRLDGCALADQVLWQRWKEAVVREAGDHNPDESQAFGAMVSFLRGYAEVVLSTDVAAMAADLPNNPAHQFMWLKGIERTASVEEICTKLQRLNVR